MTAKKDRGLGRGLGALFDSTIEPSPPETTQDGPTQLPIQRVEPNPLQPRKTFDEVELSQLADSIREHGIIQPLTVRRSATEGYYQIIAGERRWRAAREAGLQTVPALIIEADDQTVMELALIENLQRQDLNPVEEAMGFQSLIRDHGMTQEEAAQKVGRSRSAVANSLRLLSLPKEALDLLEIGALTPGHARAVLSLKTEELQLRAVSKITGEQLSVRQAEALCKRLAAEKPEKLPEDDGKIHIDYLAECEKDLSNRLGRGVKIVRGRKKGRFELEFYDDDDLNRLLEALQTIKPREVVQDGS